MCASSSRAWGATDSVITIGGGSGTVTASRPPRGGKSETESGEDQKHGATSATVRVPLPEAFRQSATAVSAEAPAPPHPLRALALTAALHSAVAQITRRSLPEPEACSYGAETGAIVARYATAIDAARRSGKPRAEIEAIIRALRDQQALELAGVRDRRRMCIIRRPQG